MSAVRTPKCPILVDKIDVGESLSSFLSTLQVIGLDCEGVNLGPEGDLTLAQVSTPDGQAYVFDILYCPELIYAIRDILESTEIIKIIHDCRGERSNLFSQFGIYLRHVFDTQIAFYFLKPLKNERISLTNLSRYYRVEPNPLKEEYNRNFYNANPDFWARRPLSPRMIQYASADVSNLHLFYQKMESFWHNPDFRRLCDEATLTAEELKGPDGGRNSNLRLFTF